MIHARPLIGKASHRRFRKHQKHLEEMPEGAGVDGWGRGFRKVREDVPTRAELDQLRAQDKRGLGL